MKLIVTFLAGEVEDIASLEGVRIEGNLAVLLQHTLDLGVNLGVLKVCGFLLS